MAMKVFVTYPISHLITVLNMYFKKLKDFAIIDGLRCPMLFAYVSNPTKNITPFFCQLLFK